MLRRGATVASSVPDEFVDGIVRELGLMRVVFEPVRLGAVYFGGGTASLLSGRQFEVIWNAIALACRFDSSIETTFEGEPVSLLNDELRATLRANGVTRVSFGLQTFDARLRALLGRTDSADDLWKVRSALERSGFEEINVDYLYALPGTTAEFVERELRTLRDFAPTSIDCHPLKYASCAPRMLQQIVDEGLRVPTAELRADMFEMLKATLEADGFAAQFADQYSLAERTKTNRYMRFLYGLDGGEYVGLGPGARSHYGDYGIQNEPGVGQYLRAVASGERPIGKKVFAPHSDNYVTCFPKRADSLSTESVSIAFSADQFVERLANLTVGGYLSREEGGYRMTRMGLRWYQRVQEELLSESQRQRHRESARVRSLRFVRWQDHFHELLEDESQP
jgi:oxygen-independent coproporphyrinogen-3 oxidase